MRRNAHSRRPLAVVGLLAVLLATLRAAPLRAQEQERGSAILARLIEAYESFDFTATRDLSLRLLQPEVSATPEERAQATFFAAATSLLSTPPDRPEARRLLARGIRLDVFARPDTLRFSAELQLEYERARRSLFAIGVRELPSDTVLGLDNARVGIEVGGTRPATVSVLLESVRGTQHQIASNVRVAGLGRVPLQFAFNGAFLPTGSYVLKLEATDDSAGARTLVTIPVSIVADSVIVAPLPDTLRASVFRPERRPWGPARRALLGGVLVGALTAAVPQLLTPPALKDAVGSDSRAIGVGALVAMSGLVGLIASKPGAAVAASVAYNRDLRAMWATERQRIIADNDRRRGEARIRLQFGRPSQ